MFPIYHSLYKHLPPLFPPSQAGNGSASANGAVNDLCKLDLPIPSSVSSTNHFLAAAAAAAMEAAAVASAQAASNKLDQRSSEESISPSPPVVTSELSSKPFLKFSVNAILSKAKAESNNHSDQEENAVKTTSDQNQTDGKSDQWRKRPFPMIYFFCADSSPFVTSASTSPSTPPIITSSGSLTKPVPRPLGASPLFSNAGNSPLQSLLYRHPYLSGIQQSIID